MIPGRKPLMGGPMGVSAPAAPRMGPMDIGAPPESAGPGTPPNLREAEDPAMACGGCMHFAEGACSKFAGYPVEEVQVCDAFEAPQSMAPQSADPYEMEA